MQRTRKSTAVREATLIVAPGMDRRQMHDLNRLIDDETQRRSTKERRETDELRSDWVRISKWSSMYVGGSNLKGAKSRS